MNISNRNEIRGNENNANQIRFDERAVAQNFYIKKKKYPSIKFNQSEYNLITYCDDGL